MKLSEFELESIPYEKRNEVVRNNPEYFAEVNLSILQPLFTRGDVGIELRKIYHWEQEGLLKSKNENREWRKYSFVEYVWLKIIEQLRSVNIGLETIHKIKADLFTMDSEMMLGAVTRILEEDQYSFLWEREDFKQLRKAKREDLLEAFQSIGFNQLWAFVGAAMHSQSPATILATQHGILGFFVWNEYGKIEKLTTFLELLTENSVTIQINLFDIIRQFLKNEKIDLDQYYALDLLTEGEKTIIDLIRQRKFVEVSIYQKNGEIDRIATKEKKTTKDLADRIYGLMKKGDYKKIEINVEDGNVVTYTETKSIKIKKAKK